MGILGQPTRLPVLSPRPFADLGLFATVLAVAGSRVGFRRGTGHRRRASGRPPCFVLLLVPDRDLRRYVQRVLARMRGPYPRLVLIADTAVRARDVVRRASPALVIVDADVVLSEGHPHAGRISLADFKGIPVLLLTGSESDLRLHEKEGEHLAKPFNSDHLTDAIRRTMQSAGRADCLE